MKRRTKKSSLWQFLAVVALLASACGSDSGSSDVGGNEEPTTTAVDQVAPTSDETSETAVTPPADDVPDEPSSDAPTDLAPGTARITIGDTTWEGTADINCLDFGIALGFQGHDVDNPETTILLDANTDDATVNSATVDIDDSTDWRAGDTYVAMGATIPTITAAGDGYGAGSATFVNILGDNETAEGTYEFYCG